MSRYSKIPYLDAAWNPFLGGCRPVSEGCEHCYAQAWFRHFYPKKQFTDSILQPDPLIAHLTRPKVVGIQFTGDLAYEGHPDDTIRLIFDLLADSPQHVYVLLTKRPQRLKLLLEQWCQRRSVRLTPDNWWVGVTVETLARWERVHVLREMPVRRRWLSLEPLLLPLAERMRQDGLADIEWIVAGGETGRGARLAQREWMGAIQRIAAIRNIPFYLKAWGTAQDKYKTDPAFEIDGYWRILPPLWELHKQLHANA